MKHAYIVGTSIYLRPFERADISDRYHDWMTDHAANPFLYATRLPVIREDLESYFENQFGDDKSHMFAVCDKATEKHIGNARLYDINWIDRQCIYGWLIGDKNYRGKGLGSDTLIQLLRFGFHDLGLNHIYGKVTLANKAAVGSNEKIGMTREGVIREDVFLNGGFYDSALFGMLRAEFDSLHGTPEVWAATPAEN